MSANYGFLVKCQKPPHGLDDQDDLVDGDHLSDFEDLWMAKEAGPAAAASPRTKQVAGGSGFFLLLR